MLTGTVLAYYPARGYGYIHPDEGGEDIIVHDSAVRRAGMNILQAGQRVHYQPVNHAGRSYAEELRLIAPMRMPLRPAFG
jgi:CspA family cold shock protein